MNRRTLPSALLLLATLAFPALPAAAATYLKVTGTAIDQKNAGGDTTAGALAADNVYTTLSQNPTNKSGFTQVRILATTFGTGFTEESYGYIGVDMKMGIEYRLSANPVVATATEYIRACYRSNPSGNPNAWTDVPVGPVNLDTTAGKVSAAAPEFIVEDLTIPDFKTKYPTWAAINGSLGTSGFDCGIYWVRPNPPTTTTIYVDQIYLRVLAKLLCYDWTNEAGNAIYKPGGKVVTEGATNVPLLRLVMKTFSNTTVDLTSLRVDLEGTNLASTDITAVRLIRDNNKDGDYDAGTDTIKGTVTSPAALTDIVIAGSPLLNDIPHNGQYLVTVDIAEEACAVTSPKYVGARIVDHTYLTLAGTIDEVVKESDLKATVTTVVDNITPASIWPAYTGATDAARVKILRKPNVVATMRPLLPTSPVTCDMGDAFAVQIHVVNDATAAGGADRIGTAENVLLKLPLAKTLVSGTADAVTSTVPIAQTLYPTTDLASGYTFEVTYSATLGTGVMRYAGEVQVYDPGSARYLASLNTGPSADITVNYLSVPILQIESMNLAPSPNLTGDCSDDQKLALEVRVKNAGTATAPAVGLYRPSDGTPWAFDHLPAVGRATVAQDASSPAAQDIAAGATQTWSFQFTPSAPTSGPIYFEVMAKDSAGRSTTGNSNQVSVVNAGALQVVSPNGFYVIPTTYLVGMQSNFNVVLKVKNTGGAGVKNVVPATPGVAAVSGNPSPPPAYYSGPDQTDLTIAPGATATFTWVYKSNCSAGNVGQVDITNGAASGKDVNTGYVKSSATTTMYANTSPPSYLTIDQNTHPKVDPPPLTSAGITMLINYSAQSNYYVVNTANAIYAYDRNGTAKWGPVTVPGGSTVSGLNTWVETYDGPVDVLFIGTAAGRIYAVQDGGVSAVGYSAWDANLADSYVALPEGPVRGFVVFSGYLYVASGSRVFKIDMADRSIAWSYWASGAIPNSVPAVDNGYAYVGYDDGCIRSIAVGTGSFGQTTGTIDAGKQFTSPFVCDGVLYSSDNGGKIVKIPSTTQMNVYTTYTTGAATAFSDVWVEYRGTYLWASGLTNKSLYKINQATMAIETGWPKDLSALSAIAYLGAPLTYEDKVFAGSYDATNIGKAWILNAADGAPYSSGWPYAAQLYAGSRFVAPVCLDAWNFTFLLGGGDGRVYIFSTP